MVTEHGYISLSVDGLGILANSGVIQVEKPAGATVRGAYFAAASTGYRVPDYQPQDGDITLAGEVVEWEYIIPSTIYSFNVWANVTDIVKPVVDAAPSGRVDLAVTELISYNIDGEVLAVIFDDPNQTVSNTIVLLFGAQNIDGDTFHIGLGEPLDKSDPKLVLDLSLGISFGYIDVSESGLSDQQYSVIQVNSQRLTTAAGGQDDSYDDPAEDGSLITVGGLDDSNGNPADPFAYPAGFRTDDELYNLLPFVASGDTAIDVYTINPSDDDNIFFGALFLASATAIVNEGIVLAPAESVNDVGTIHTVTATLQDDVGNPVVGREVVFLITSGPHAGVSSTVSTGIDGRAEFSYIGVTEGKDTIVASFVNNQSQTVYSNEVIKTWEKVAGGLSISPDKGTMDTIITIQGEGFGELPGVVRVDKWTTKLKSWSDEKIVALYFQQLPPGPYDVQVIPNEKSGLPVQTLPNGFTIVAPEITRINVSEPVIPGDRILITGTYFGGNHAGFTAYVWSKDTKWLKWKAQVLAWEMDGKGNSSALVIVPDIGPGNYNLRVRNLVSWSNYFDGITVAEN